MYIYNSINYSTGQGLQAHKHLLTAQFVKHVNSKLTSHDWWRNPIPIPKFWEQLQNRFLLHKFGACAHQNSYGYQDRSDWLIASEFFFFGSYCQCLILRKVIAAACPAGLVSLTLIRSLNFISSSHISLLFNSKLFL